MNLKTHLLSGVCLSVLGSGLASGAYSGTDPEIEALKEDVKKLKAEITEMKEKDKSFEQRAESLEEELKKQPTDASEQIEKLEEKVKNLETSLDDFSKSKSDDTETKEENVNATELEEMKQAILTLHEGLEAQEKLNEQRNLEAAKQAAEIDKLKKQNSTSSKSSSLSGLIGNIANTGMNILSSKLSGNGASDIFGSVLQGGLNMLSQKLNPNYVREKISRGQPVDGITKDMTQDEKEEFQSIAEGIMRGQSNREIQAKMDALKEKIADRSTKEAISEIEKSKFQKLSFFGLNKAFSSATLGETVTKIYDLSDGASEPPLAQDIFHDKVNSIDQEVIDAIYTMVAQGATLSNIFDCLSFHTEGAPMKIERKDKPKGEMVNSLINMVSENNSGAQGINYGATPQQQSKLPTLNDMVTSKDNTQQQGKSPTLNDMITSKDNTQQPDKLPTLNDMVTSKDNTQQPDKLPMLNDMVTSKDNTQQPDKLPTLNDMVTSKDNTQQQGKSPTLNDMVTSKDNTQQPDKLPILNDMVTSKDNVDKKTPGSSGYVRKTSYNNKETTSQSAKNNVMPSNTRNTSGQNQQGGKATPVAPGNKPQARELDENTMTLMDIADNAYYDVNRHKFMKIAATSKKYPRLLTVQPLDTKSAELLKRNLKTAG